MERYARRPDGQWLLAEARGLDQAIPLISIDGTLALAEVYDRVSFDTPATAADPYGRDAA